MTRALTKVPEEKTGPVSKETSRPRRPFASRLRKSLYDFGPREIGSQHSEIIVPDIPDGYLEPHRIEEIFNEFIVTTDGGAYREHLLAPERQDELAKELSRNLMFLEPKSTALSSFRAFLINCYVLQPLNLLIRLRNLVRPESKMPLLKNIRLGYTQKEVGKIFFDRQQKAFQLLQSGKVTSGRAQYLLAHLTDREQAKDLLLGETVTNEVAQIELAEKLHKQHAREVLATGKLFPSQVDAILRHTAEMPKSLPPASPSE